MDEKSGFPQGICGLWYKKDVYLWIEKYKGRITFSMMIFQDVNTDEIPEVGAL